MDPQDIQVGDIAAIIKVLIHLIPPLLISLLIPLILGIKNLLVTDFISTLCWSSESISVNKQTITKRTNPHLQSGIDYLQS